MIKPDHITTTTCPYCGVGCTLQLHVKDNFIFKVTSPFDSPVNQGNLCVKGRYGYDFVYHPKRVTKPLIRKTPQKAGVRTQAFDLSEWREATWDEALDYVADRLVEIYRRDGPDAMAVYCCAKATNEDNYLLQKMYRALFRTNNVDHCTRLCHAGSVVALQQAVGSSAMSNTASQVIQNDVFIVTGSNTSENHPIVALQMKDAVMNYGAKMIVIDPRRIELVDFAEMWLPLKPGTNVPVFSAMAHVIVKENLVNWDFVNSRTENLDEFLASLEKFTPEFAEEVSGVPAEDIRKAARLYANAGKAAIYWGMGISQLSHGTASAMAIIHLAFLTGHIGRDGTGLNPLRGQNNVQGASDMGAMPFHYPGYMRVDNPENRAKWEKRWNIEEGGLSLKLGLTTTEILSHAHEGGVRALYIMGENPMMSEPNLNLTRHHMQQLEFIVAQDIFINESGAFADVFLPATPFAEKDGTFSNTDRRVQRVRAAHPPRGDARPDWRIICDLARRLESRLGRDTAFWDYSNPEEILREMASVNLDYAGIAYERIEKVGLIYPVPDLNHPGTPTLFTESFPRGRGKFHPLDYVPVKEPVDDEFPFILTTGRILEHWHGGTLSRNSALDEAFPEARVEIHPADADIHGIRNDDPVRVTSRRGEVVLRATVTEKTTVGVVFIPWHFHEAAANLLTNDALDPQAKIPEFKACAVQVFPAREDELANPDVVAKRGRY
ncbi:MAG: formate dehydrogenase subunit alpha [Anaerolineales bacterium]|jgi:formate dehydrogenase alpha subunit|nr:Formate dehydrogenase H [Anaerolineales bacterium]MCZ7549657.1 formate dehydrogenase subunit alpha [Anaerolineales bacterium]MDX9936471.1 formate dehydrogenase subunit alpha [Anaerolineales bacterium]OQY81105.1 MAG: formate dehydrogenase subunit alpha [Anaerolineae bacterium UTCFX3]GER80292.1 formate dehydrogenase subunit alpha [Candidatus Denitrolinea symbiosum]